MTGGGGPPQTLEAEGELRRDAKEAVWCAGGGAFDYSDGDATEARLYADLRAVTDRSEFSAELRERATDWASTYHFSPLRGNLLRHLPWRGRAVLELGAGCGAVTRFLGEAGATVTAVEGSVTRARCAARRCAGLDAVRVYAGPFDAFTPRPVFDAVLLIGVLEYAARFDDAADPIGRRLAWCRRWLRPGGELVVAIENQLGLKYLLGAPEDHVNKPYHGVADGYRPGGVRTLGRSELADAILGAGFGGVRFASPFPDYKLPAVVVTEAGFDDPNFDAGALLRHAPVAAAFQPGPPVPFDARRVWGPVLRNGLGPDLSPSFLVRAGRDATPDEPDDTRAYAYAADRAAAYATATSFVPGDAGGLTVRKRRLRPEPPPAGGVLEHRTGDAAYVSGRLLETELLDAADRRDADGVLAVLSRWCDFLQDRAGAPGDAGEGFAAAARPESVDWIPRNLLVRPDGTLAVIDPEWTLRVPFSLNTLALRYLTLIGGELRAAARAGAPRLDPPAVAAVLNLDLSDAALNAADDVHRRIYAQVLPGRTPPDLTACFGVTRPSQRRADAGGPA